MLCELFCKTNDEISTYSPESNPCLSHFLIHFLTRKTTWSIFISVSCMKFSRKLQWRKGCLQTIIRFIRWINHLTMFNQSYSNILRITGSSFKSWRHLCIVRWSVLAIALKPVFSPFPNLRVLDTPLIQFD